MIAIVMGYVRETRIGWPGVLVAVLMGTTEFTPVVT